MNYIVFDLEATCWKDDRSKPHEIIEIGAVKVVDGLVVDKFQKFVRPILNTELSPFCIELTSIQQEDVDSAEDFPVVLKEFQEWIGEDYQLCSWGFYDKTQLIEDCTLWKLPTEWMDKRHISVKHQYQVVKSAKERLGLGRALKMEGLKFEGTQHRGIDDAINISKIFIKYINEWKYENTKKI